MKQQLFVLVMEHANLLMTAFAIQDTPTKCANLTHVLDFLQMTRQMFVLVMEFAMAQTNAIASMV